MDAHWWRRIFLGNAVDLELDGAGRILVSPELRAAADIEKEVILLGMGSHLELWDAAIYAAKEQAAIAQGMPEALKQFNF
jgi:MraZ protein